MEKCKDCKSYNQDETYPETGYCSMWEICVKEIDSCEDWEE